MDLLERISRCVNQLYDMSYNADLGVCDPELYAINQLLDKCIDKMKKQGWLSCFLFLITKSTNLLPTINPTNMYSVKVNGVIIAKDFRTYQEAKEWAQLHGNHNAQIVKQ